MIEGPHYCIKVLDWVRRPEFYLYLYPQDIYMNMRNLSKYLQFTLL